MNNSNQPNRSDKEQQLLDAALRESEQLLARSLKQEQWQRKVWWSTAVVVGVTIVSFIGFTAGRATADKQVKSTGPTDAEWRERLLAVKEDDSWFDGAQIGMELVRIPGNRSFKMLSENWNDLSINARQQILKGFTPGMMGNKILHQHFFDVMNLGMSDSNPKVREYAAVYIEMQGLPNFANDLDGYKKWWEENKNRPAEQIVELTKKSKQGHDAIDNDKDFKQAWQSFFARDYVESEIQFREILKRARDNPHAMNGLGWSLLNQKKYDEAKPWLEKAVAIEKDHWGALNGLAVILKDEDNIDEAVKIWERIAMNSTTPNDATANLAEIYMERKQYAQAIEQFRKLVEWFPDRPELKQKLAEAEKLSKKL